MKLRYTPELLGLLTAVLTALVLGSLLGAIVFFSPLKETTLNPLSDFTLIVAVFAGTCLTAWRRGNRGLLRGITLGLVFFAGMLVLTLCLTTSSLHFIPLLRTLFFTLAAGGLGGILGVGLAQ